MEPLETLITWLERLILPGAVVGLICSVLALRIMAKQRTAVLNDAASSPLARYAVSHYLRTEQQRLAKQLLLLIAAGVVFNPFFDFEWRRLVIRLALDGIVWLVLAGSLTSFYYWNRAWRISKAGWPEGDRRRFPPDPSYEGPQRRQGE